MDLFEGSFSSRRKDDDGKETLNLSASKQASKAATNKQQPMKFAVAICLNRNDLKDDGRAARAKERKRSHNLLFFHTAQAGKLFLHHAAIFRGRNENINMT